MDTRLRLDLRPYSPDHCVVESECIYGLVPRWYVCYELCENRSNSFLSSQVYRQMTNMHTDIHFVKKPFLSSGLPKTDILTKNVIFFRITYFSSILFLVPLYVLATQESNKTAVYACVYSIGLCIKGELLSVDRCGLNYVVGNPKGDFLSKPYPNW